VERSAPHAARDLNNVTQQPFQRRFIMGRSILLWLIGVPIPIIILLALFLR
jgi:hypothetical protein